jgi:beta-galactosidase
VAGVQVALLHDNEAGWAVKSGLKPVNRPSYADTARAYHRAFFDRAVTTDVVAPWTDLHRYRLVVVPGLFLITPEHAKAIADYANAGGTVIVTWFSGIVDEHNTVLAGGYPGAFRELLGVRGEEFHPLTTDERVALDNGWSGHRWSELLDVSGDGDTEVVARYDGGDLHGRPAITKRRVGAGWAWYVSTDLDDSDLDALLERVIEESGVTPVAEVSPGVEAVRRTSASGSYLFLINHSSEEGWASVAGTDLLSGIEHADRVTLAPGSVAVIEER